MNERQQELERRLQDVTGQLGSGKKSAKKGKWRGLSKALACGAFCLAKIDLKLNELRSRVEFAIGA